MARFDTITMLPTTRDSVAGYEFDAIISEEHAQKLTVTENPIETGVNIADHCYVEGSSLTLVGSVSDIKMPNAPNMYDSTVGRSNDAYQLLADLQNQLASNTISPFQIVTSVKVYNNMVMTEISMHRDNKSSLLGRFQMQFKQIITVDTKIAIGIPQAGPPRRAATRKETNGNKQPKDPDADEKKQFDSWAKSIQGGVSGFLDKLKGGK